MKMILKNIDEVKTAEEARQIAVDWQAEFANRTISWRELSDDGEYFQKLGEKFNLTEEFNENGII